MRRREVIGLLGGAGSWLVGSSVSWGQLPDRTRRIGVLADLTAEDPRARVRLGLFLEGLREAGWVTPFFTTPIRLRAATSTLGKIACVCS